MQNILIINIDELEKDEKAKYFISQQYCIHCVNSKRNKNKNEILKCKIHEKDVGFHYYCERFKSKRIINLIYFFYSLFVSNSSTKCKACMRKLKENYKGKCPFCGSTGRIYDVLIEEGIVLSDSISMKKVREYYEKNIWKLILNIVVVFVVSILCFFLNPILGVIVSVVLGIVVLLLVPYYKIKIREIDVRKEERGKRKEERGKRKEERGKRKEERGKRIPNLTPLYGWVEERGYIS